MELQLAQHHHQILHLRILSKLEVLSSMPEIEKIVLPRSRNSSPTSRLKKYYRDGIVKNTGIQTQASSNYARPDVSGYLDL
jgi:hypothetical protein